MFFYTFLQPEMFSESAADGEDAMQNLASILNGFLQNCFLAVFEDDRWSPSVKETLLNWPETSNRKRVMSLLVQLKKHKRFLYCIVPDYLEQKTDLDSVFEQAAAIPLDLILVTDAEKNHPAPTGTEIATRRSYQNTVFEPLRSSFAVHGKTCKHGEMNCADFLNVHFARALKYASEIHLCDRICGSKNFADNFIYTVKEFMHWLGNHLSDSAACKIVFHLGQPKGLGIQHVLNELEDIRKKSLPKTEIELRVYNDSTGTQSLPHQRFIMTDQLALNIDRGLDFLDRATHKCRDTFIGCQNPQDAQRLLDDYSSCSLSIYKINQ